MNVYIKTGNMKEAISFNIKLIWYNIIMFYNKNVIKSIFIALPSYRE